MHIKSACHAFIFLLAFNFIACSSDEMPLTVGDGVMDDDHLAYYLDDFKIESKTMLADYVSTNNTGIALCGSYLDDYIGRITTNTVFKISPNISSSGVIYDRTASYDSISFVMFTNNYVYGDSTKAVNMTLHRITEDLDLDTLIRVIDGTSYTSYHKANNKLINYDPADLAVLDPISFIPEDVRGDSIEVRLDDVLGKEWFDKIIAKDENYTLDGSTNDTDDKFIDNVLKGLTLRSASDNSAVIGFNMPTSADTETKTGMTIRIYYHTTGPYTDSYLEFIIYDPSTQYNQVTADFSTGLLKGIEPGGPGIPSSKTDGLTFIQSGLGLMTNIEIPTLHELYLLGNDLTIIDLDLDFETLTRSFSEDAPLPSAMTIEKLRKNGQIIPIFFNGEINIAGLLDFSNQPVSVIPTSYSTTKATYSIPITRYGWEEQDLISSEVANHNSLILTARSNGAFIPNINRMVIGDSNNNDCEMKVKMHYTIFE